MWKEVTLFVEKIEILEKIWRFQKW
jgi:hypothetical protein